MKFPLRYDSQVWSIVFPLGMLGVSSILFGRREDLGFMQSIGTTVVVVACVGWILAAAQLVLSLRRRPAPAE